MLMPGRKYSAGSEYRYGFNGKENDKEIKAEGNIIHFEYRDYDSRLGRFFTMDPIASNYPMQSPYVFAGNNPIKLVDILGMGPGDPTEHKVAKGDNLTKISKKYGVSIDDLMKMNDIKDKDKISKGQILRVNPEADFSHNPRGGYQNPQNSFGPEVEVSHIAKIGIDFVFGEGLENSIIVGGRALRTVQKWRVVQGLVEHGIRMIKGNGNWKPGDFVYTEFRPGDLPSNILKGVGEAWDDIKNGRDPWASNSLNSPIHVIGSFNMTIRVNANGTTATVCIYDSKTLKSATDNNASDDVNKNRQKSGDNYFTNTYQRYIWNVTLLELDGQERNGGVTRKVKD